MSQATNARYPTLQCCPDEENITAQTILQAQDASALSLNDLQRFLSPNHAVHLFIFKFEPVFCVKPLSRNVLLQNVDFHPSLTHASGNRFDTLKDTRA